MQTQFLPVAKVQVAVARKQIVDHLSLSFIAGSCLSALTIWLLSYRLAAILLGH